jgi:hypothetical protein
MDAMARIVRMPSEAELPPGPVRNFAALLFWLYRQAHRPALRDISEEIRRGDFRGTASPETIRRMLRGVSVPANWATVQAVYLALCELAGKDPGGNLRFDGERRTIRGHIEAAWHEALDNPGRRYSSGFGDQGEPGPSQPVSAPADDPWAADAGGDGFSDEPPF